MHLRNVRLLAEDYPTAEHYPFCLQILRETGEVPLTTPVTLFVGENGTGKSTLLEAMARRCGIHIWQQESKSRADDNPYERGLYRHLELDWVDEPIGGSFFGAGTFRHFVENLDEWASMDPGVLDYFGGRSLMAQSHGQSLMSFFESRYSVKGLYLLDEPETALSPSSQLKLLRLLEETGAAGHAQFVVATHSPILLACPGATIYSFDTTPVTPIAYEDTQHFQVYRDFLTDRERYVNPSL